MGNAPKKRLQLPSICCCLATVETAPGMAHSITNLSATEDLVTLIWASEPFDPERPDTFHEEV